jgi:hypothetical protein
MFSFCFHLPFSSFFNHAGLTPYNVWPHYQSCYFFRCPFSSFYFNPSVFLATSFLPVIFSDMGLKLDAA